MSLLSYSAYSSRSSGKQRNTGSVSHHTTEVDVDFETSALIAKLALEDIEEAYGRRRGKARAGGVLSDEELAYQLQSEHFQELINMAEDNKIAKSLEVAVTTDATYLEALRTAEEAAAEDRLAALALSRGERLPEKTQNQLRMESRDFVMHPAPPTISTLSSKGKAASKTPVHDGDANSYVSSDDDDNTIDWSSEPKTLAYNKTMRSLECKSAIPVDDADDIDWGNQMSIAHNAIIKQSLGLTSTTSGPSVDRSKQVSCTICTDTLGQSSAMHTPCGHYYCQSCVRNLVELFTRDESLYPLRCCQEPIPVTTVVSFVSTVLRKAFETKNAEYSVLSKDRIYCCSPTCSKFLGSSIGRENEAEVVCNQCFGSTCPRCKQVGHPADIDCAVNRSAVELHALARREGWQTCPGCHALVELHLGCYHMTCRCRAQFCYLCAVPWKNCTCPQWEENRLLATAQQRVENEVGQRVVAPAVIQRRVLQRVEALRVNHHCERHNWSYRQGGGRCEECHFRLPSYLLICRGCSLLACVRCSRNRF